MCNRDFHIGPESCLLTSLERGMACMQSLSSRTCRVRALPAPLSRQEAAPSSRQETAHVPHRRLPTGGCICTHGRNQKQKSTLPARERSSAPKASSS